MFLFVNSLFVYSKEVNILKYQKPLIKEVNIPASLSGEHGSIGK